MRHFLFLGLIVLALASSNKACASVEKFIEEVCHSALILNDNSELSLEKHKWWNSKKRLERKENTREEKQQEAHAYLTNKERLADLVLEGQNRDNPSFTLSEAKMLPLDEKSTPLKNWFEFRIADHDMADLSMDQLVWHTMEGKPVERIFNLKLFEDGSIHLSEISEVGGKWLPMKEYNCEKEEKKNEEKKKLFSHFEENLKALSDHVEPVLHMPKLFPLEAEGEISPGFQFQLPF